MKTWVIVLSILLPTSVACSVPALHGSHRTANRPAKAGSPGTALKPVVANHAALNHPSAEPLVPRRAGAGASPLSPDKERAFLEYARVSTQSLNFAKQGDVAAKQGDWAQAQKYYQQALKVWPDDSLALYGMGCCAGAAGDTASAVRYYQTATYADNSPHSIYNTQTNDVARLMEFTLLLSKAGQEQEALSVYRRAAGLLNYMDGKQNLDVLLPDFGPGGWTYTPQRMEAMAHVAIAYQKEGFDKKLAAADLEKAIALAPDSPVPYFYKGRSLIGRGGRSREALVSLRMAARLGDADTKAAVDKQLKDYGIERDAKMEQEMEDLQKKQAAQKK